MKKKVIMGLACLMLFGVAYAKTKKPAPTAKQTNTTVDPPLIGEWRYGILRESDDGWMRCEEQHLNIKCALIIKKVSAQTTTNGYYLYVNTSADPTTPDIKKYDVDDVLFDTDTNGNPIFKTSPPVQLN